MPKRFLSESIVTFAIPGRPLCSGNYGARKRTTDGDGVGFTGGARTYMNIIKYTAMQARVEEGWVCDDSAVYVVLTIYLNPNIKIPVATRKEMLKNKKLLANKVPSIKRISSVILKALKGVMFKEDKNVVALLVAKKYDATPRVEVLIGKPKNFTEMAYDIRNA